jgi:hypothetical protein
MSRYLIAAGLVGLSAAASAQTADTDAAALAERQAAAAAVLALPADAGETGCSPIITVKGGPDGALIGPAELAAGDARAVLRPGASLSARLIIDGDCVPPETLATMLRYLRALAQRDAPAP